MRFSPEFQLQTPGGSYLNMRECFSFIFDFLLKIFFLLTAILEAKIRQQY